MVFLKFIVFFSIIIFLGFYAFIYPNLVSLSDKGKKNRFIILGVGAVCLAFFSVITFSKEAEKVIEEVIEEAVVKEKKEKANYVKLDVPLINQMEEPSIYNGCEVTSLAMVMNYYGLNISKNELAEAIPKEPLQHDDGTYGDPRIGFVGDIYGDESGGYSVYVEPILELAEETIPESFEVKNLTDKKMADIFEELALGRPVWCITTVPIKATDDIEIWNTKNGDVEISWNVHSVVLTGYDSESVFINDPYGEEKAIPMADFEESWEQMGSQAMTIVAN